MPQSIVSAIYGGRWYAQTESSRCATATHHITLYTGVGTFALCGSVNRKPDKSRRAISNVESNHRANGRRSIVHSSAIQGELFF